MWLLGQKEPEYGEGLEKKMACTLLKFSVPFVSSLIVTTTTCGRYYFHLNEDKIFFFLKIRFAELYYARPFI